jgi:class 3 adenylate cyclase
MTRAKNLQSLPSGLVTFMFTDIVGSTQMKSKMPGQLSSEREAAFVQRIKDPHDTIVAERVKARDGFIIKGTGDGFMIAFADAEKAVLCAVEIQESLSAAAIFTPDGPLQIRIGLNSGHAEPTGRDYTASAVDKAARVESKAEHGQVYISRETYAAVRNKVRNIYVTSAGNHAMKGVGEEELFVAVRTGQALSQVRSAPPQPKPDPIPKPPAFYTEPPYIGSHKFVGRQAQLERLSDWAEPADPHPILLFEAIGGAGKSMLTWEWTTNHATKVRGDWEGRFWYSFYEKGAVMGDFCQRALAYITEKPLDDFRKKKTTELGELLLHQLQARPWLLILDGLERVLVAYHRFDAAQVADEQVNTSEDQIANRNLCDAIRPEDGDLLRILAVAAPSKLLVTTRLTPRVLLNHSNQPIPGVLRLPLPGLLAGDAEALLRSCSITGTSREIQNYLKTHCDCHPLVTGVLAGLVNDYLPDRGNFDAWAADAAGGGKLNLANLNLVQKRNNILHAALSALPEKSRQLLSTLALLSESVDYPTLSALNPHLPPEPEKVEVPDRPEDGWRWERMADEEKEQAHRSYQSALQQHKEYEDALIARRGSPEFLAAPQELSRTVGDLERRGLLQYDPQARRYDLHPVVRGIAAGGLRQEEKEHYGQRVVDHFSQQAHNPYNEAETLEDIRDGLHIVRTLLQMGRHQQACDAFSSELATALSINLEAHGVELSLLRPFFPQGWATMPDGVEETDSSWLASEAADALMGVDEPEEALALYGASLVGPLRRANWTTVSSRLGGINRALFELDRLAKLERCILLRLDIAGLIGNNESLFNARLHRFHQLNQLGRFADAESVWQILCSMGSDVSNSGPAASCYARFRFFRGDLTDAHLAHAEHLMKADKDRYGIRQLLFFRGEWRLERHEWALAAESFQEAVRMAREVGLRDVWSEARLAIAKFRLHQLPDPRHETEQLARANSVFDPALASLWLAIGDGEQAKKQATIAYKGAWADGEPYVHRYRLNQARAILDQLGAEIPSLPPYDPAKDEKLPWEDELTAAIEKLHAEKKAEKLKEASKLKEETKVKKEKRTATKTESAEEC